MLIKLMKHLLSDEKGSAFALIGFSIFGLVAASGAAVDYSRAYMLEAKMSAALDSAGLAAGAVANTRDIEAEVQKYFKANMPDDFMDATFDGPHVTMSENKQVLNLDVSATLPTAFMKVFGMNEIEVSAEAEITRANKGLELILVMDTTGSMASNASGDSRPKIDAMKQAATDLIDILYGDKEEFENLYVGLVSYGAVANIGAHRTSWIKDNLSTLYPANYPAGRVKWKGCVFERTNASGTSDDLDTSDEPPSATNNNTLFNAFFWQDCGLPNNCSVEDGNNSNNDNNWIRNSDGNITIVDSYSRADNPATLTTENIATMRNEMNNFRGPNTGCGQPLMPMVQSKTVIKDKIKSLIPWGRGGTASSTGIIWSWRMLSPKWRGMWEHVDAKLPLDYKTPLMEKVVVMLTDGENNFYTPFGSAGSSWSDFTGYRRIGNNELGVNTKEPNGRREINNRTLSTCIKMKAEGIIIYTITFGLSGSGAATVEARNTFRSCASKPEFYFDSPNEENLKTAFRTIGDSLANLRISK